MKNESRVVVFDSQLKIEAYLLQGIVQPFPNHFHEYYVFGLMKEGQRFLKCKGKEYHLKKGDLIIFNPNDNHECAHLGDSPLTYYGINIPTNVLQELVVEITGSKNYPVFFLNVIQDQDAHQIFLSLHQMIMEKNTEFEKEETLLLLVSHLLQNYHQSFDSSSVCDEDIEKACAFIEEHYHQHLSLDEISKAIGLSKSTLLRGFTKRKGITPYRYLETLRISKARKYLEDGLSPIDVAHLTGFCDQSHFTNDFNRFIGLSPGMYREIFNHEETTNES